MNLDDFIHTKKVVGDKWELFTKKFAYPYENFKKLEDYNKTLTEVNNEHYFSKLTRKIPNDEEIARTNNIIQELKPKTGKDLTMVYCKSDTISLAETLKNSKRFYRTHCLDPFYSVYSPGFTYVIYIQVNKM